MTIKVSYQGYDLSFDHYPTPAEVKQAYGRLRSAVQMRLANPELIPARAERFGRELPMSFAQEWFWSLEQMSPGNPTYHLPVAARLAGPLNADALERSLSEVCRRHEVLRATFISVGGRPVQMVSPPKSFRIPLIDLSCLAQQSKSRESDGLIQAESRRPFDLAGGPALRAMLIRLAPEDHVIFLMLHHIVGDAWATNILTWELTVLYSAFVEGRPSVLPDLRIQYADFAQWQRRKLRDGTLHRLINYWKEHLAGAPPMIQNLSKRARPAVQGFRGAKHIFELPVGLAESIRAFSAREGATVFMTLIAGFCALLYRITGQDDIVIGSPISGRNRAEIEGLIGCFVNTLPIRTDLSGNPKFRELLGRIRQTALGAFDHQDLPFERIVEAIRPSRSTNHTPLYQVAFDLNNTPPPQHAISSGLKFRSLGVDAGVAKLDLLLDMWWGGVVLAGSLEYNTALFESAEIEHFAEQFETLLHNVVERPQTRLDSLDLSTRCERQTRLTDERKREILSRHKFMTVKPRAVTLQSR